MIEYTSIYKNGKIDRFFIKIDDPKEFNFLQPYFFITSIDKPRHGNILEMDCLFSCNVWQGRQRHGWGYSSSHDTFSELIQIIKKLYNGKISENALNELNKINTHDSKIILSNETLNELNELNNKFFVGEL